MPLNNNPLSALIASGSSALAWTEALGVALSDEAFSNTWAVDAGSACRAVFTFDSGLRLTWAGDGNGSDPDLLQIWHESDVADACPVQGDFSWNTLTQTWEGYADARIVVAAVNDAISKYGLPRLVLPWEFLAAGEWVESLVPLFEQAPDLESTLASAADISYITEALEEIDAETDGDAAFIALVAAVIVGGVRVPQEWGSAPAVLSAGDKNIPPNSPLARFYRFMNAMEERGDWVIVWDECCRMCFTGTYQMLLANQGLEDGAPALILYGQNAQMYWRPDGTLRYEFYLANHEEAKVVAIEAVKAGLAVQATDESVTVS